MGHKALICGGRKWRQREITFRLLDEFHTREPIDVVIHGAAVGADTLAGQWALSRGIHVREYPVSRQEWQKRPGRAGHDRNQKMLDREQPSVVIAFPGGGGTADMKNRARRAGVRVVEYQSRRQAQPAMPSLHAQTC